MYPIGIDTFEASTKLNLSFVKHWESNLAIYDGFTEFLSNPFNSFKR